MENEKLKIFDEQGAEIGTAPRSEVHKAGHWHETFHCWFTERTGKEILLYFQVRSAVKKDYPGLLDITAAGHILANESAPDGLREVKEELGIDLSLEDLHSLGMIKDSLTSPGFIDNELCHVFLYDQHQPFDNFMLQREEVSGIMLAKLAEFEKLWFGKVQEITVEGFLVSGNNEKKSQSMLVTRSDFVPHEDAYIESVIKAIKYL
ncbi:NUDIX domain-containing protein [Mesobacillus jeotgali]|jgi:isopentenyldiphosphate isomerase|uniref:NUDIX domain-containing protein n=1 Tax=Mesobacillus jeotgali TaxID=129985 RepID=A0ABY9VQZ9_9BACI|nr:NUDIX domain-containing protein [Mesobacillus jeotgali]WNF24182.1 NUDIX domain-containing protein [Mesobacillus jeotgali]